MKDKENKIKEIGAKLDKLLEKAGQFNKYQFIILILFSFQFICSQFFNRGLSFLETKPYVFYNSSEESHLLTQDMCLNRTKIKVDETKKSPSIICDFEIYCDKFKIYFIKISLYSGMILGSFLSYNFADKLGRRKSLLIVIPFHILSLYLFELMKPVVFGKNFTYMIIYVCDIINQKRIPLFITLLLACLPFSESITSYVFNYPNFDWRHILAIIASFNIIIYFILVFLLVGSPMFSLNNEDFDNFVKYLMKISKINGKILKKEDFSFLKPYMSSRQKSSIFSSLLDDENENENDINEGNFDENNLFRNDIDFELKPGGNLVKQQKSMLKEDFLEDYDKNEGKPITSLFGKLKMRDYSPFDLFRKSQIKNFLILSFLWIVSMIIRNGISMIWKNVPEYQEYFYLSIFMFVGEFIGFFIVYKLFTKHISTFHSILVSLILLNFIFLLVLIRMEYKFNTFYFFELLIVKVICGCMFLILIIITSLIYPLLIRTKGLGGNLAIATIGDIIALFVSNELKTKDICLYFLMFEFFGLVFSYGLPNKIGTVILQEPYKEDNKKELENEGGSSNIIDDEENEKINKSKLLGSEPISLDIIKKK